jgi:hypothetical protein
VDVSSLMVNPDSGEARQAGSPPPVAIPAAGSGPSQTFHFTFTDPAGWQNLDVVNILINSFLDGRNSCYLAFSRPLNTLYLMNDAGTALLPGLSLGGSGTLGNAQCTASGTAAGSGTALALNLNTTFSNGFAGNKVVYLAQRNLTDGNSGWQVSGTWGVPRPNTSPSPASVSPPAGEGMSQTFTFTFSDNQGWQDLGVVNILINGSLDGRQGCYLAYSRPAGMLFLVNDSGTGLLPPMQLNGSGTLANSQCSIAGAGSSATGSDQTLTLKLNVTFAGTFKGNHVIYAAARDATEANNSGWHSMGTWFVR